MQNPDIARLFTEVADLLEIEGENPFRVRAYRNAARTIADLTDPLVTLVKQGSDLTELQGIGEDLAGKITTIVKTGSLPLHKQLVQKLSPGVLDLLHIPGLGPKRVKLLRTKLKVKSAADLAKALDGGKVAKLPGFGAKIVEKIRAGIGRAAAGERRVLTRDAEPHAQAIIAWLKEGGAVEQIEIGGSYRRRVETVADLDILVTARKPAQVFDRFAEYPDAATVEAKGRTRATIKLRSGLQVDLRVVDPDEYGAALLYFTGSKAHNIELRQRSIDRGYKLSEYGLFKGERRIAGRTEADVYAKLDLEWIPPELREARGEIKLAAERKLPTLVTREDIKADLQMHSEESDGTVPLAGMVDAARALGHQYIAITDHGPRMSMAGLTPAELRDQWKRIDKLNKRLEPFRVLKSVEMDIRENGELDLSDDVLAEADYVVATIHYGQNQPPEQLTERVLGAIANRWVDAIGHPTGRIIGKRDSYRLDFDAVWKAAASSGCLLEINGSHRMDLPDTLAASAKQAGCRFVLSTDGHSPRELGDIRYAVDGARRAGLEARDILNAKPVEGFLKGLRRNRK